MRYLLAAVLLFTVFINLTFIFETSRNPGISSYGANANVDQDADNDDDGDDEDGMDADPPEVVGQRAIDIKVKSSKAAVEVIVAGVKIIEDTKNRGIHVAVLHQVMDPLLRIL